ncbi:conserved Plasmodium protein, unknown function [Plasmodium ovale curtisi]|uniref:Uncharacterized protein n=1 Tax=Plasmodium ovale curtisi TaxID=864141 RepID=A0A1A8W6A7_PLAOA|nr:conserved Plasmodium protein, unknown function [Plasmodium ovale curtisi]SBT02391.1 conserved Plasmodium protein, unknown function [Plasmodium ovale curtisi]
MNNVIEDSKMKVAITLQFRFMPTKKTMKTVGKIFLFYFLALLQQLYSVSSSRIKKNEMSMVDFLPSNSLLYPLDFQQNWQASEPIPLNIHFDVPSYGHKDLLAALEYHNDLENYKKEKCEKMTGKRINKFCST